MEALKLKPQKTEVPDSRVTRLMHIEERYSLDVVQTATRVVGARNGDSPQISYSKYSNIAKDRTPKQKHISDMDGLQE